MGSFRFRRTVKLAPGVRLNINKKSVGLSAGVPGARISKNTDGRGTRSVGIPGTGLYWREQTSPHSGSSAAAPHAQQHVTDLADVWEQGNPADDFIALSELADRQVAEGASDDLAETRQRMADHLAESQRQIDENNQAEAARISAVSIDVPTLDGGHLTLSFTATAETLAHISDQALQRVVWEGGSAFDHHLADDPKYEGWTPEQLAQAEVDQLVRLNQQVRREVITDAVTNDERIVAELGEAEASRAADRLADAIEAALE